MDIYGNVLDNDLSGLQDGTFDIDAGSLTAQNLTPSSALKTDANRKLVSARLDSADLNSQTTIDFTEGSTPTLPSAGQLRVYSKANSKLYILNDSGLELELNTGSSEGNSWQFSTNTTATDPGSGIFNFDNVTPLSVTQIVVSEINGSGADIRPLILTLQQGDQLYLTNSNQSNSKLFTVNGPVIDNTTFFIIPAVVESQNSVLNFINAEIITSQFFPHSQDLQTAFNVSNVPQITTANEALTLRNGVAPDTNNVLEIQNLSATTTLSISGDGNIKQFNQARELVKVISGVLASENFVISNEITAGALLDATSANNLLIGQGTGANLTSGDNNILIGKASGELLTTTNGTVAIGHNAGKNLLDGINTSIGLSSMLGNPDSISSTGDGNTGVGQRALQRIENGTGNTGVGKDALRDITSGNANTGLGVSSLTNILGGSLNVALGTFSGDTLQSGFANTLLGDSSDVATEGISWGISLGQASIIDSNQQCKIGGPTVNESITSIVPGRTSECDLGSSTLKYKDIYTSNQIIVNNNALNLQSNAIGSTGSLILNSGGTGSSQLNSNVAVGLQAPLISLTGKPTSDRTRAQIVDSDQLTTKDYVDNGSAVDIVTSISTGTGFTPDLSLSSQKTITAQADVLIVNAPTGTAVNGRKITFAVKQDSAVFSRAIVWNAIYRGIGVTLPPNLVTLKWLYIGMIYNSTDNKWDVVALSQEA